MAQSPTLPPLVRGEWTPMSYEEFLAWAPEGMRTEWTDGEGIVYVSTGDRHQWMIALLSTLFGEYARIFGLGRVVTAPYPVKLWPDGPHREPDVMFVARGNPGLWTPQRLYGAPDLAAEALSEETANEDRGRKLRDYAMAGAREYLMTDARPGRDDFAFLRLDADRNFQAVEPDDPGRYHSLVLPGLWLDPNWFRQDPLPHPITLLRRISPEAWRRFVQEIENEP